MDLSNTDLSRANLEHTNLERANLKFADLSNAQGIPNEELEQQAKSVKAANMPDGSKHP
jgi:uncharacterized protein YjbI with pentapeptide repeats